MMKLQWKKCPSVTRARHYFYTAISAGCRYWVVQEFKSPLWIVHDDCGAAWGSFKTVGAAKRAVQNNIDNANKAFAERQAILKEVQS